MILRKNVYIIGLFIEVHNTQNIQRRVIMVVCYFKIHAISYQLCPSVLAV